MEISTFGGIASAEVDASQLHALLKHPKHLGLLLYLAVEGKGRIIGRDELTAIFWPEMTEHHARQSLNQAVHSVRSIAGQQAIVRRHLAIEVGPKILVDTSEFDAAYAAEAWSVVVESYRGEFLAGFIVAGSGGFDDWTSRAREAYRRKAAKAAHLYGQQLGCAGALPEAARILAWAAEIAPEQEQLALAAVNAFAKADQVLLALDWFARHTARVEDAFGCQPSRALLERVTELTAVGRAIRIERSEDEGDEREQTAKPRSPDLIGIPATHDPVSFPPPQFVAWSSRRPKSSGILSRLPLSAFVVMLLSCGAYLGARLNLPSEAAPPRAILRPTTLVLHIEDRNPGKGSTHLAQTLSEMLAARLSDPPRLQVALTSASSGEHRETHFAINGFVYQDSAAVYIELALSDAISTSAIRHLNASLQHEDMPGLLVRTVEELAESIRVVLGSTVAARTSRSRTSSAPAWHDLDRSRQLAAQAKRFAARGASDQASELLTMADSLADRASRADPDWLDARLNLVELRRDRLTILLSGPQPDLALAGMHAAAADSLVRSAARHWPLEPKVHELAGVVAYERWLTSDPRSRLQFLLEDAVQSLREAIALDPIRAQPWVVLSAVHSARRDHMASLVAGTSALERDVFLEHTEQIQNLLFHASFELGMDEEAATWCDAINVRKPGQALGVFCELYLQGWTHVRRPDVEVAASLVRNLTADPPAVVAAMTARLGALRSVVAARSNDLYLAKRLLKEAVGISRADAQFPPFHAAALMAVGDTAYARDIITEWLGETNGRLPVERWFRGLDLPRVAVE